MKILLNGELVTVFSTAGAASQVAPGYVQLNVGKDRPTTAITVPVSFWEGKTGGVYTSGNSIKFPTCRE